MRTARIFYIAALLMGLAPATPAAAQGVHAALAISTTSGAYGFGYNYDTPAQAQSRAMTECAKYATDCKVYANFQSACIAIARGDNKAFGWAIGFPNDERPERALNECASQNGTACKIVTSFCTGIK